MSVAAKEGPLSLVFGEGGKGDGGIDGKGGEEKDVARKAWELRRHIKEIQKPVSEIEGCEKPVICVVSYSFSFSVSFSKEKNEYLEKHDNNLCKKITSTDARHILRRSNRHFHLLRHPPLYTRHHLQRTRSRHRTRRGFGHTLASPTNRCFDEFYQRCGSDGAGLGCGRGVAGRVCEWSV